MNDKERIDELIYERDALAEKYRCGMNYLYDLDPDMACKVESFVVKTLYAKKDDDNV